MPFRGLLSEEAGALFRRLLVRSLAVALVAAPITAPAAAQMLVGDGSVECGGPYVISSGDTLSGVSQRAYGDPLLYGILADANWDALGGDPEHVTVGMSITIPCIDANGKVLTPEEAAEAAASLEAVVVAEGPLTPAELDTLFGPAALFPDQVLTPVLVAVTFPLDVVKAARFVEGTAALSDQERAAQAADKPWDDSVRELAAGFPDLVTRMSDNIDWTEQAGEAVVAQTDEVLAAIQRLRTKAQENGYLVDNEAQKVEEVNDNIVISPASPGVVYVPTYDAQVVYTTPVVGPPVYHYGYDPTLRLITMTTTGTTRSWQAASSLAAPSSSTRSSMTTTGMAGTATTTSIGIAATSLSTAATWTSTSTAATSASATATGRASATGTDRRSATETASASATAIAPRSTVEISPASAIARVIGRALGLCRRTGHRSRMQPAVTSRARRSRRASPPELAPRAWERRDLPPLERRRLVRAP